MKNPFSRTLTLAIILSNAHCVFGCFTAIFNFGDSITDTGNALFVGLSSDNPPAFAFLPYGETYFHHPTGRCSDGRVIVDFIAQHFGLPLLPPYLRVKSKSSTRDLQKGVNFAFAGATALSASYLEVRGIQNVEPNVSLGSELDWFREILPSVCDKSSNCSQLFSRSLFIVGGGGNDYGYAFAVAENMAEVEAFVPSVVQALASAVAELIELGAKHVMVSGTLPFGCCSAYLTRYMTSDREEYNDVTGCLNFLNEFTEYHNEQLQAELNKLQELYPQAQIIYADYYNASMCFYRSPEEYGFTRGALTACCGAEGPYNYNASLVCGYAPAKACDDPSLSVSWDGVHLTEAAYRSIAKGLLDGPFTIPPLRNACVPAEHINHHGSASDRVSLV